MKSVRFDEALEFELREAAEITGQSESEVVREAVRAYCRSVRGRRLDRELADVIGSVSCGGDARHTGRDFKRLLAQKDARRQAETRKRRGRRS